LWDFCLHVRAIFSVARRVSPAGLNVSTADWAPDGRQLALRVTDTTSINDYFYHSRVVLFDVASRAVMPTALAHVAEGPKWSPDGKSLLASEIRQPGFIGLAPRILDIVHDRVTPIADSHPGLLTQVRWASDGHAILALSFERTRSRLVRIDPRTGHVAELAQLVSVISAQSSGFKLASLQFLSGLRPTKQTHEPPQVKSSLLTWRHSCRASN